MIEFACNCGKVIRVKEENAGRSAHCPACGVKIVVPNVTDGQHPAPLPDVGTAVEVSAPSAPNPGLQGGPVGPLPVSQSGTVVPLSARREPPARRPIPFARRFLYGIAWYSGLAFVSAVLTSPSREDEARRAATYVRSSGSALEALEAGRDLERKLNDMSANARNAVLVFTVALAGLAASSRQGGDP